MITQIFGVLIEKNPPFIVVDVNGIGYEISVPMSSYYLLPEINQKIKLLTHFIVKEDGHFLYGFVSEEERYIFRLLLKVSGIGAKIAIAILSGLSVKEIAATVELNESIKFQKIPGIGKKTAERLVLELKDKIKLNNINNINNIMNKKFSALNAITAPTRKRIFACMLYEFLVIFAVILIGWLLPEILITAELFQFFQITLSAKWQWLHLFLLLMFYNLFFWLKSGQTLAMKTWKLKLVDSATNGRLRPLQAVLRYFAIWLSTALFCIGFIFPAFDKYRRSLHDIIAGTNIISVE